MPKRAHSHITSSKRKRGHQDWINAQSEGNAMIRQFRIARGESGLRIVRRRRVRPTFHSSIRTMTDVSMGEGSNKRAKVDAEARMIPGIDGNRIFGFPNTIITKLRYCDTFRFTSTAGSTTGYVFAANGLYDPDLSSTGHQPMYFDQYTAIYDQYVVIGAKIKVTGANDGSTAVVFGINGDDDSSGTATLSTKMEQNNSAWITLGTVSGSQAIGTVTCTFEPLRDFGIAAENDGASATAITANPTELWTFQVFMSALNSATCSVDCTVEIDYTVKFTELRTPTPS